MLFIRVKLSTCSILSPSPQGEGIGVRLNNQISKKTLSSRRGDRGEVAACNG